MKKMLSPLVLGSLLIGVSITMLLTANMEWTSNNTVCSVGTGGVTDNSVSEKDYTKAGKQISDNCYTLTMGYPKNFLYSNTDVEINRIDDNKISLESLSIGSSPEIDTYYFLFNWLFWSAIAVMAILLIKSIVDMNKPKKAKTSNKKR